MQVRLTSRLQLGSAGREQEGRLPPVLPHPNADTKKILIRSANPHLTPYSAQGKCIISLEGIYLASICGQMPALSTAVEEKNGVNQRKLLDVSF